VQQQTHTSVSYHNQSNVDILPTRAYGAIWWRRYVTKLQAQRSDKRRSGKKNRRFVRQ